MDDFGAFIVVFALVLYVIAYALVKMKREEKLRPI